MKNEVNRALAAEKKIFTLLVAAMCYVSMMAEIITGPIGENLTYSFNTEIGTLNIDGTGPMYDYSSSSKNPFFQSYRGSSLYSLIQNIQIWSGATTLGEYALADIKAATSISIPSTVTEIREGALYNCANLKSITLPMGLEKIGRSAFMGCKQISSIWIYSSVSEIGGLAFGKCTNLESIDVSEYNEHYVSYDGVLYTRSNELVCYPTGKQLSSYKVVDGTTTIYGYAFSECTSLQSIILPQSLTKIHRNAFDGCSITSVTCYAVYPPTVYPTSLDGIDPSATIYVPKGSKIAYEIADQWKNFNIEEMEEEEAIDQVQGDEVQCTKRIENGVLLIEKNGKTYNAQGAEVR